MKWVIIPAGVFAGACMTVQARVNSAFAGVLGNATLAALISFLGGVLLLAAIVLSRQAARERLAETYHAVRRQVFPWWLSIGGLGGAFFVFTQGAVVAPLGIALFTVAYVAGQMVGSFVWDHVGLGPGGAHDFSFGRVAGATLAVLAVVVSVSTGLSAVGPAVWLAILPLAAGIGSSWQQAVNGRLQTVSQIATVTTFWNFIVGTVALAVMSGVELAWSPLHIEGRLEWWMFLGGPIGVVFIATQVALVSRTGTLVMSALVTLGQLAASLGFAAMGLSSIHDVRSLVIGPLIASVAVGTMLIASRRGSARSANNSRSAH